MRSEITFYLILQRAIILIIVSFVCDSFRRVRHRAVEIAETAWQLAAGAELRTFSTAVEARRAALDPHDRGRLPHSFDSRLVPEHRSPGQFLNLHVYSDDSFQSLEQAHFTGPLTN